MVTAVDARHASLAAPGAIFSRGALPTYHPRAERGSGGDFRWCIPGEPIGQGRPRACVIGGRARMYTPKKSDSWCGRAVEILACHWDGGPSSAPVMVTIDAVFSRPKRLLRRKDPDGRIVHAGKPDADNVAKAALDALSKSGVIRDDAQVCELLVRKWYAARDEGPQVVVSMREGEA